MCTTNVLYYFYLQFDDLQYPLAVINLFSIPDVTLLSQLHQTVYLCRALEGQDAIRVIPITSINLLISMFPDFKVTSDGTVVDTQNFALLWHPFFALAKYNTDGLFDDKESEAMDLMIE